MATRSKSKLHEEAINPNIPSYITSTPWYLHAKGSVTTKGPVRSLKHQRNWKKALASTPYDAKRDRWSGYDSENYACDVVSRYEARDEARSNFLKQQNLQSRDHEKDDFKLLVGATTQTSTLTTATATTSSRARKDTPTYLLNSTNLKSAYYNSISNPPPSPLPNTQKRISGPQTQAEFLNMNYKISKDMLKSQAKSTTDAAEDMVVVPKSKFEEDVFVNNHSSVWGSWWKGKQWGYKCCKQTIRNSNCTAEPEIKPVEELL